MAAFILFPRGSYSAGHDGSAVSYYAEVTTGDLTKYLHLEVIQQAFQGTATVAFTLEWTISGVNWSTGSGLAEALLTANGTASTVRFAVSTISVGPKFRIRMDVASAAGGGVATVEVWGSTKSV